MISLFLFGTFWFWVLLAAVIILEFTFEEYENGAGATVTAIATVGLLQFFSDVKPLTWVWRHPYQFVAGIAAYILIGVVWGRFKWILKCHEAFGEATAKIEAWLDEKGAKGAPVVPPGRESEFRGWSNSYYHRDIRDPIRIRDYKAWFIRVASFWPISVTWTLCNDFVQKVFTAIYNKIAKSLQGDSDRIFKALKPTPPIED